MCACHLQTLPLTHIQQLNLTRKNLRGAKFKQSYLCQCASSFSIVSLATASSHGSIQRPPVPHTARESNACQTSCTTIIYVCLPLTKGEMVAQIHHDLTSASVPAACQSSPLQRYRPTALSSDRHCPTRQPNMGMPTILHFDDQCRHACPLITFSSAAESEAGGVMLYKVLHSLTSASVPAAFRLCPLQRHRPTALSSGRQCPTHTWKANHRLARHPAL
jgi:hypothetical protein